MCIFKVCSLGNNSPHQPHSRTATACTHGCNQGCTHWCNQSPIARLTDPQSHHKLLLRQFHSLPDLLRLQSQSISENHEQEKPHHQYFESAHQNLVVWSSYWCRTFFHTPGTFTVISPGTFHVHQNHQNRKDRQGSHWPFG